MVTVTCKYCGERFERKVCEYNRNMREGTPMFCNNRCSGFWMEAQKEHRSKVERNKRRYENRLKRLYDMTLAEYDEMLETQGGGCWICGRTPGEEGKRLAVDHCHTTGKPRGLLCGDCNRGIGMFRDNPQLTTRATEYLLIDW